MPTGGVACPYSFHPQHATLPLARTPQVCASPALTELKTPECGEAWLLSLSPQQATVPSARTPHVWIPPALTEAKIPDGGDAWPKSFNPQQPMTRRSGRRRCGRFRRLPIGKPRAETLTRRSHSIPSI